VPLDLPQAGWASQLRALPESVRAILEPYDDRAVRARPAPGEWSAIEVLGHLIDKLEEWHSRVERVLLEERPFLAGYDQDARVRERDYQHADRSALLATLTAAADRFATTIAALPDATLSRQGVHGETGPITLQACVTEPIESTTDHLAQMRSAIAAATAPPR
jgi:hypothetical protein